MRQRLADVALTAKGPGMVGLQHRLLFHDRFVVVCPRSHPLGRRKALTLKDLAGHPFIRLIGTNLSRPIYLVWPSAAQLNPAMQAFVDLLKYPPSLKPLGESLIN